MTKVSHFSEWDTFVFPVYNTFPTFETIFKLNKKVMKKL